MNRSDQHIIFPRLVLADDPDEMAAPTTICLSLINHLTISKQYVADGSFTEYPGTIELVTQAHYRLEQFDFPFRKTVCSN